MALGKPSGPEGPEGEVKHAGYALTNISPGDMHQSLLVVVEVVEDVDGVCWKERHAPSEESPGYVPFFPTGENLFTNRSDAADRANETNSSMGTL